MARIFRLFAYLYHLVFAVYLFGISVVALMSHNTLNMPFLPWSGAAVTTWLIGGSVIAVVSIFLAVTGVFRFLFPLWTLAFLIVLIRGFLLQPYSFSGPEEFRMILWIILGAVIAFLASLTLFARKRR